MLQKFKEKLRSDLSALLLHSKNNPKFKEHLNHSGHDYTSAYQLPYGKWKHINKCPTSYLAKTQSNRLKSLTILPMNHDPKLVCIAFERDEHCCVDFEITKIVGF